MITPTQIEHLAAVVAEVQPAWHVLGIKAALRKVADRDPAVVAAAAIRAAQDGRNRTPEVIALPGQHWSPPSETWTPASRHTECRHHPGQHAGRCAGCRSDQLAAYLEPA